MQRPDPYEAIAENLGGRLIRRWTLHGGVSANVQALELAMLDGTTDRVVVRQHGAAGWKPLEQGVTSTEHDLLHVLADSGFAIPRPRLLDLSGTVLETPYLVLPFVEGTSEPTSLSVALERMANFLARLHDLDVGGLSLPAALPRRDDPIPEILEYLPDGFPTLRTELARPRDDSRPKASLLHGDFWPGNILWQRDEIAAVIDWEDAAVGDPLSDVACCRVEVLCKYGEAEMDLFTTHYMRLRGQADPSRLALWEVLGCSGALAFMDRWGLDVEVEAARRATTWSMLERACNLLVQDLL